MLVADFKNRPPALDKRKKGVRFERLFVTCDPAGTRTQDPYIKSVLLYQLSYGIIPFFRDWECKDRKYIFRSKYFLKKLSLAEMDLKFHCRIIVFLQVKYVQ